MICSSKWRKHGHWLLHTSWSCGTRERSKNIQSFMFRCVPAPACLIQISRYQCNANFPELEWIKDYLILPQQTLWSADSLNQERWSRDTSETCRADRPWHNGGFHGLIMYHPGLKLTILAIELPAKWETAGFTQWLNWPSLKWCKNLVRKPLHLHNKDKRTESTIHEKFRFKNCHRLHWFCENSKYCHIVN